jgi:hypothetical protein
MDMVERVARAMAPAFAEACSYWCEGLLWTACTGKAECACRHYAFEAARAAIAAMREPPIELYKAAAEALVMDHDAYACWHAMIDAALTSSKPQAPSSE